MTSPRSTSASDDARARSLRREGLPPLVLLLGAQASLLALDPARPTSALVLTWSLLPLVAFAWLVVVTLRALRRADEYQRGLELEAMSVGFGVMLLVAFAGGVLDAAELGSPRQSLQLVLLLGVAAYLAAGAVRRGRRA